MTKQLIAAAVLTLAITADALAADTASAEPVEEITVENSHGFRLGYTYVNLDAAYFNDPNRLLDSPHMFTMGYELTQTMDGGGWLDVITVENFTLAGLDQSKFIPSANFIVGFEIDDQIQVGVGPNFTPFDPNREYVHMVTAVGWTPKAGAFNVPIHATFIPDPSGNWRFGTTIGVNWK